MQEILTVGATEQAQSQLQGLTTITDDVLASARDRVTEGKMTKKDFADLSEGISSLTSAVSAHAERHGELTHLRIPIGQKPVDVAHTGVDTIVSGLLDTERHRKGIVPYINSYKSRIGGLYIEKAFGLGPNSSRIETFHLSGTAHLPANRIQR